MQQVARHRVNLPIFHDGRLLFAAVRHLKQSIVAAGRTQNLPDLLGVHSKRKRSFLPAVKNGRDISGNALPARFILAARFPRFRRNYDLVCHCLLPF